MALTVEQWNEIKELEQRKDEFPYAQGGLGRKSVTMLLGGIGFGKSTIIQEFNRLPKSRRRTTREIGTVATRRRKPEDPEWYRTADEGVTHESFLKQIYAGELVNWSFIPQTGHLYGSDKQSFHTAHTLMPALPSSVPQVLSAGFKSVNAMYVMPESGDWYRQFKSRIDAGDPKFYDRLEEARESIEYGMKVTEDDIDITRVVNHHNPESLRKIAEAVLELDKYPHDYTIQFTLGENFNAHAATMHAMISDLIESGLQPEQDL